MVWLNNSHHNSEVPYGVMGGSRCVCPKCKEDRRIAEQNGEEGVEILKGGQEKSNEEKRREEQAWEKSVSDLRIKKQLATEAEEKRREERKGMLIWEASLFVLCGFFIAQGFDLIRWLLSKLD